MSTIEGIAHIIFWTDVHQYIVREFCTSTCTTRTKNVLHLLHNKQAKLTGYIQFLYTCDIKMWPKEFCLPKAQLGYLKVCFKKTKQRTNERKR